MKSPFYVIIALLIIIFGTSCNNGQNLIKGMLLEKYVRTDITTDTLILGFANSDNMFELRRGCDTINGNKLPKTNSGIYEYKISNDTIAIRKQVYSILTYSKFYFKANGSTINMGNFIDSTKTTIQFEKLK